MASRFLVLLLTCLAGSAGARTEVAFWLAPRANTVINQQVATEVGRLGGMVVLRAAADHPDPSYAYPALVDRLKRAAPDKPVLAYALTTRAPERGRIEAQLLPPELATMKPLVAFEHKKQQQRIDFVDVTNPQVRQAIARKLSSEQKRLGVDGFALDLITRTPTVRPVPLARMCQQQASFCPTYAQGVDALFADLRRSLGSSVIVYNGLLNFAPNQIEDQARLLQHADAAAIEFFGLEPDAKDHAFSRDILPFLRAISALPAGKRVLVFGRGPQTYSDYARDYYWQRYLYGAFLLAARPQDLFKYHASFQIPAHAGRTGGLDVFADWSAEFGNASGPMQIDGGLYRRDFARGEVIVAPDDGRGGTARLSKPGYTLEGEAYPGQVRLGPGEALIVLDQPSQRRPVSQVYTAAALGAFAWPNAKLSQNGLMLQATAWQQQGYNDLLLDYERSLTPYNTLEIAARLTDPAATILAVAEVDDPRGRNAYVVVAMGGGGRQGQQIEAVQFGAGDLRGKDQVWPVIAVADRAAGGKYVLDGASALRGTDYRFRRWSHVRFTGGMEIAGITLAKPARIQN